MNKKICIFSLKGGVGKTALALNIARNLDTGIITNEPYTMLGNIMPKGKFLQLKDGQSLPALSSEMGVVYDMGGFLDNRLKSVITGTDILLVPTTPNVMDIQGLISTLTECKELTKNIVVVANRCTDQEYSDIKDLLHKLGNFQSCPVATSLVLANLVEHNKSVQQLQKEGGLMGYALSNITNQLNHLEGFLQ